MRTAKEIWATRYKVGADGWMDKESTLQCMEEYASQFKPKWVEWEGQTDDEKKNFDKLDISRILLKFDDGTIRLYDSNHPFAVVTHYLVLLE